MRLDARIKRLSEAIRKLPGGPRVGLSRNEALAARGLWLLHEGRYDYHAAAACIGGDVPDVLPDGCRLIGDDEAQALIAAGRCPIPVEFVAWGEGGHESG